MKLSCLTYVVEVLENCQTISKTRVIERHLKGIKKSVVRYELVHKVKRNTKIRVVVEKVGTGKHKFLSVMPHDNQSKPPKKRPVGRP
ncbi:MAG: hypothetical protein AAB774_00660 [Patescibacteria group bacterium]